MGDITRNLSRREFRCRCGCGLADPHPVLVCSVQELTDRLDAERVIVRSGSRCAAHNAAVGGAPGSLHLRQPGLGGYTCAGDLQFPGVPLLEVVRAAEQVPAFAGGGLGVYIDSRPGGVNFVHVDCRRGVARWGNVDGFRVSWPVALAELQRRMP